MFKDKYIKYDTIYWLFIDIFDQSRRIPTDCMYAVLIES